MKNIISIIIAIMMIACIYFLVTDTFGNNPCYVGDTQKMDNVSVVVTRVEDGTFYGTEKSSNGKWVRVYFTMENFNDEPYRVSYSDFTINDTYTIRETNYRLTNIESGGFNLVKGNKYEFWCVFDCSYGYAEKDLIFIWDNGGIFGETREWVI